MPIPPTVFPNPPFVFRRTVPLEEQETSYFADSAKIFNFFKRSSVIIKEIVRDERVLNNANIHYLPIATFHFLHFFKKKMSNQDIENSSFQEYFTRRCSATRMQLFWPRTHRLECPRSCRNSSGERPNRAGLLIIIPVATMPNREK